MLVLSGFCRYCFVLLSCVPCVQHGVHTYMYVYYPISTLTSYHSFLGSMPQTDRYINTQTDAYLLSAPWMQVHPSLVGYSLLLFTFISAHWSDVTHLVTSHYRSTVPSRYCIHRFPSLVLTMSFKALCWDYLLTYQLPC